MNKAIQDKIIKSEFVEWKLFEYIQSVSFKELTKPAYDKLKQSIINNNFVESFKVWQNGEKLYCLDGYHRCLILKELETDGWNIPLKFRADFIDCKDKKEAAKLITIYSSIYAHITDEGLYEFISTQSLDFGELKLEMDIPGLDLGKFEAGYFKDDEDSEHDKQLQSMYEVVIDCDNETDQQRIYDELSDKGYKCRVLTL